MVAPKREKLQAALKSLREKEKALEEAMYQLQKLQEKLQVLQEMYDAKMKEKEDLIKLASGWIYNRPDLNKTTRVCYFLPRSPTKFLFARIPASR